MSIEPPPVKPVSLTEYARTGYQGNPNSHLATSPAWYAHALGQYLRTSGRSIPTDVRMGRGYSIRSGDMRFLIKGDNTNPTFERVQ